ncbi:MAG: hypothetical protein ABI231_10845 [Candidatus Tumulicola sp.]
MEHPEQRGSSLIETAIAIAIASLVAGAALGAAIAATHAAGSDPTRDALQSAAQREMLVALDVLKYQGASIVPVTVATTLPMPAGSPLPAELSIATSALPHGAIRVAITAVNLARAGGRATLTATLSDRAPLPGTVLRAPGLVPAPTGAP